MGNSLEWRDDWMVYSLLKSAKGLWMIGELMGVLGSGLSIGFVSSGVKSDGEIEEEDKLLLAVVGLQ